MQEQRRLSETEPRRFRNPRDGDWHVQLTQGETYVTDNEQEVLTTILGSCISACIRDPRAGIGGMNHFLLPNGDGTGRDAQRYGVHAMELLINELLKRGGMRERFEAKLFGGANVIAAMSGVGTRNAAFAKQFLADEGIRLVGGDTGGSSARRIQYWPVSGRVRQMAIVGDTRKIVEREVIGSLKAPEATDDIELF